MPAPPDEKVSVTDAPAANRFEIHVGEGLAGFTMYRPAPNQFTFFHTEIDEAFSGRGLASKLIKYALDEMRSRGLAVLPECPFVRRYIQRHEGYLDLVPAADRRRFGLPSADG